MKRMFTLSALATVVLWAQAPAKAQFSISFGSGCARPFGISAFYGYRPFSSGGLHYGVHSAPHYGQHFGTHVGPFTNAFGFRDYGLHSGIHSDFHSGIHNDLHDITGHTGPYSGGLYGFGQLYGIPTYGYSLYPGYFSSSFLSYGTPYGASYFNARSMPAITSSYQTLSSGANDDSRGRGGAEYLPELSYDRTKPKANTKPNDEPDHDKAAKHEKSAAMIYRADVQIEFLNGEKSIDVAWLGDPDDVDSITFMIKDTSRMPLTLRKISYPPFKARFNLSPSIRYVSVDVEFKDGVTSGTQIPLPGPR